MKHLAIILLLAVAPCFGQSLIAPAAKDVNGVPTVATVTVCNTNPGRGTCGSLVTTYTSFSVSITCSGTGAALSGTGCSNPGSTDAAGNVIAFAAAGQYWCQYSGATSSPYSLPCSATGGLSGTTTIPSTTPISGFALGQPIVAGATTFASSNNSIDCSQLPGATLDVILNSCEAFTITSAPLSVADARALGTGFATQSIQSLVQINQLLKPTLSTSTSGSGTSFPINQVVTVVYTITSPTTTTPASTEAQITCPGAGNCFVGMSAPPYPGTGTSYTMYAFAGGLGYSELACPTTGSIVGASAFYGTGAGGCNGAAVTKGSNKNNEMLLPPQAAWICHLTGTDCITVNDHGLLLGNMAGSSGGMVLSTDSTTNLSGALLGTDRNAKNAGGVTDAGSTYVYIEGLEVDCISSGAVCTGGAIRWAALGDSATLANVQAVSTQGCSIEAYSTGYTFFLNVHGDGFQTVNAGSTAIPLCVGKAGSAVQTSIEADNLVLVHPGSSSPNLQYRGGAVNLHVGKLDMEYQNNTANCGSGNAMIDVGSSAAQGGMLQIHTVNVGANCTGSTVTVLKLESNATQVDIDEMNVGGQTGTVPVSDLRAGTQNATPFTQSQCTGGTPCPFHANATVPYYADGLQVAGMLVSRVACINVTPVTVSASVSTDQALQACSLPVQLLNKVNRTLYIWTAGIYSTAATSTAQVTLKIKLCTVSGCGSGTVVPLVAIQTVALGSVTVANNAWNVSMYSATQTAGTSSVHEAHGILSIDLGALTTAADSIFNDPNTTTSGAINSTLALFVQVTGAFSAASSSNTMSGRQLIVGVMN